MPAKIDTRTLPSLQAEPRPGTTCAAICGLMASTITSLAATATALSVVVATPSA